MDGESGWAVSGGRHGDEGGGLLNTECVIYPSY